MPFVAGKVAALPRRPPASDNARPAQRTVIRCAAYAQQQRAQRTLYAAPEGMPAKSAWPVCAMALSRPCIGSGARTTRAPCAAPSAWWPRHTPNTGTAAQVRSSGRQTPGAARQEELSHFGTAGTHLYHQRTRACPAPGISRLQRRQDVSSSPRRGTRHLFKQACTRTAVKAALVQHTLQLLPAHVVVVNHHRRLCAAMRRRQATQVSGAAPKPQAAGSASRRAHFTHLR